MSNKKDIKSKSFRAVVSPQTKVLKILNREGMDAFLDSLSGEVDITISEVHSRTHFQNNYYWKVVIGTLVSTDPLIGHTKDEMHSILKNQFKVKTTSKLNVYEFTEYIDQIIRWAAITWDIRVPDPDDDFEDI